MNIRRTTARALVACLVVWSTAGVRGAGAGMPERVLPSGAPRPDRNRPGPWDCDVLVWRVAPDGGVAKTAAFERAGVPAAARMADGRLIVAHQHFPENDDAAFDKVAVRFSSDEGLTWTAAEVIRVEGLPEGMRFPFDPTLVALPDGRVRLYFTSVKGRRLDQAPPAIHSAVSKDGVAYTFEPGVRFGIDGRIVIDCAVVLHKGVFHLFAPDNGPAGPPPAAPGPRTRDGIGYHATGTDGLAFTRVADVRVEGARRWLGGACSDGNAIAFFGSGDGGVWMGTSDDGAAWRVSERAPRIPGADPGAVRLRDGGWLFVATGPPRPGTPSAVQRGFRPLEPPPFKDVLTHVPSAAGGDLGIAVRVLVPPVPRYKDGAPVVIHVAGGVGPGAAGGRSEYAGLGAIEVFFAFPGGGRGDARSGGEYDFRGPRSIRALADVIRFATGRIEDARGRSIRALAGGMQVLVRNCGIIGSSHGGNACGMAMALHGEEFPDLAFYASMESPYGEGAANVELGAREDGLNPAYDPATGVLDLGRLAWSPELGPGLGDRPMPGGAELRGAFFFDLDGDGRFARARDFPVNSFVGDAGTGIKAWYSVRVLAEAERRGLLKSERPAHVPVLGEAREFWRYRDATGSVPEAVRKCPAVAVIVYAGARDHVQVAPDHPHIAAQIEAFRAAGARFVRLNPDRSYVERVLRAMGPAAPRAEAPFPDNNAGEPWDRRNVRPRLEPEDLPVGLFMQAAVMELADRVQAGNREKNLDAVLFPEAPCAPRIDRPAGRAARGGGPRAGRPADGVERRPEGR